MSQTKAELIKGLNINASAPATALQIDASGNVNIDSNTLYVDATNNRVGIGTSTPGYLLEASRNSTGDVVAFTASTDLLRPLVFSSSDNTASGAIWTRKIDSAFGIHAWSTNSVERMRLTSTGLGIGTTSVGTWKFHVATSDQYVANFYQSAGSSHGSKDATIGFYDGTYYGNANYWAHAHRWNVNGGGTEAARIDSSGRLLVGTSSAAGGQIEAKTATVASGNPAYDKKAFIANIPYSTTNITSSLLAGFDGSGIHGVDIGYRYNGSGYDLTFGTNSTTTGSPTERMRIANTGAALFKKTVNDYTTEGAIINQGAGAGSDTSFVTTGGPAATFARSTNDGTIISLRQDGTEEGTISVSGTTVSYNGAHLSRWSQLPSGAERTEILRGSVLSNLDEMCEWGEEDNEQLNRMKVSDVEGDKNVSGVFQCWDDDDDTYTNDFYCAMTGDFIIRIAEGVTVERGDLLMSAGDGTAKPQDDDIIRSKTIAKVTSTNVSCTYADGSYCVPCVLMAC